MSIKNLDFVLKNNDLERVVFRFYPKHTHVHGFSNTPPDKWEGVYKVYYSWAVVRHSKEDGRVVPSDYTIIFPMLYDECSEIVHLSQSIRHAMKRMEQVKLMAFGQPSACWVIEPFEYRSVGNRKKKGVDIQVWNNSNDLGYRFWLEDFMVEDFCNFIDKINAYALAHSEGI